MRKLSQKQKIANTIIKLAVIVFVILAAIT